MKEKNGVGRNCRKFNLSFFIFGICVFMMLYRIYLAVRIHPAFSSLCFSSFGEKLAALKFSVFPSLISALFLLILNIKKREVSICVLSAATFASLVPLCGVIMLSRLSSPYISAYIVSSLIFMFDMLAVLISIAPRRHKKSKCVFDVSKEERHNDTIEKDDTGSPEEKKIYSDFISLMIYFFSFVFVFYLSVSVIIAVVRPFVFLFIVPYLPIPHFIIAFVILVCNTLTDKMSFLSRSTLLLSVVLPCFTGFLLASGISLCVLFYILSAIAVIVIFSVGFLVHVTKKD